MAHDERAMLAYANLAALSHQKRQMLGRDKFLLLAGAAACRSGYPDVATRCRALVLANNPVHVIGKTATVADAMRHPGFQALLRQLERFCSFERAEHLLRGLGVELDESPDGGSIDREALAMQLLSGDSWPL